jgi:hypothetical protein
MDLDGFNRIGFQTGLHGYWIWIGFFKGKKLTERTFFWLFMDLDQILLIDGFWFFGYWLDTGLFAYQSTSDTKVTGRNLLYNCNCA